VAVPEELINVRPASTLLWVVKNATKANAINENLREFGVRTGE
jgi:hypothetical protein